MLKLKIAGGVIGVLIVIAVAVVAIRHDTGTIAGAVSASQAEHQRLASDPATIKVPEDN